MGSGCSTGRGLRSAGVTFQGHRPCPARPGWTEFIVRVDGHKVSWCLPLGSDDEDTPAGARLSLRWRPSPSAGLLIEETDAAGRTRTVSAARALTVLGGDNPPELTVDERLVALGA